MKMKKMFALLLALLPVMVMAATDMYAAPTAIGTGDGYTAANAAAWTDELFWIHVQQRIKKADTTVHFAAGEYIASKTSARNVCLALSSRGSEKYTLTLLGADNKGSVFMRDPSESKAQTTANRLAYIIYLYNCTNVVVDNLHFTGDAALGYVLSIRTPHNVLVRNCTFTDMTGIYYGATGSSTGGSGVTWENCVFDNIGVGGTAHCIYNAYDVNDILIRNCIFRDCFGDYVRFRDKCLRCTVENCTFESTGRYNGNAFIACPQFNDEDPVEKPDPADHEYFSQNIAIRNCTFIGLNRSVDKNQFMLRFVQDGFNPVGKEYLISKSEANALTTMPAAEARAWMKARLDIDLDNLQWVNNTNLGAAGVCQYSCRPAYGSEKEFPLATYNNTVDISRLLHIQQNRAAQLPDETRAVWVWSDSIKNGDASAIASKLKASGINTVMLLVKGSNGVVCWKSSVALAQDSQDSLAEWTRTFRSYGIAVHAWFVYHSDLAWANKHPQDRVYHYGKGGQPAILTSGNLICPQSEYRSYFLSLVRELVSQPGKYQLDGIHLGIRYTNAVYCFCPEHLEKAKQLGINTDTVRIALYAGFGSDNSGNGEVYYSHLRGGDRNVSAWVAMREAEIKGVFEDVAAILAEYQPSLVLSLSAQPETGYADPTIARCQYAQNLADLGDTLDLVCPTGDHTAASQPASWCADIAVQAAARGGVPALTGMGGSDDVETVVTESRNRGGTAGFAVFRYETIEAVNFERLGRVFSSTYPGDLDHNGQADLIMIDAAGNTGAWLTRSDGSVSWRDLSTLSNGFEILGWGSTVRGKESPDIYLYSATSGVVGAWLTDSVTGVTGWLTIAAFDAGSQVVGLGDFNGDGISDMLVRSAAGDVGCWLGGSDDLVSGWHYFQSLGAEWMISGIGDLNGDGIDDVVLNHVAGYSGVWLIRRMIPEWSDLGMLNAASSIVGCGDFDGDGTDDVLIRIGEVYGAWMIGNGLVLGWRDLVAFNGDVEDIVDVDNDGVDDLRVRSANGDLGYFRVIESGEAVSWHYYGSVGSNWTTALQGR